MIPSIHSRLNAASDKDAKHLVFAPARYVSQKMLAEQNIPVEFVPLPSGARTKDGDDSALMHTISFGNSWLIYCEALSWRMVRPAATSCCAVGLLRHWRSLRGGWAFVHCAPSDLVW